MNDICDYIEKKKLQDYIQNEVILKKHDLEEWGAQEFEYVGAFSNFATVSLKRHVYDNRKFGTSPLLSTLIDEDSVEIPEDLKIKIDTISEKLNFNESIQTDTQKILRKLYISDSQRQINISMSGDSEFLIYVKSANGAYKNLLINEDGDIELLFIPTDRRKSYNKTFYKEDGINHSKVVSFFNEMREF